jgi:hypothetical protein
MADKWSRRYRRFVFSYDSSFSATAGGAVEIGRRGKECYSETRQRNQAGASESCKRRHAMGVYGSAANNGLLLVTKRESWQKSVTPIQLFIGFPQAPAAAAPAGGAAQAFAFVALTSQPLPRSVLKVLLLAYSETMQDGASVLEDIATCCGPVKLM